MCLPEANGKEEWFIRRVLEKRDGAIFSVVRIAQHAIIADHLPGELFALLGCHMLRPGQRRRVARGLQRVDDVLPVLIDGLDSDGLLRAVIQTALPRVLGRAPAPAPPKPAPTAKPSEPRRPAPPATCWPSHFATARSIAP